MNIVKNLSNESGKSMYSEGHRGSQIVKEDYL